jgi:hypothetical protein
MRLQLIAFCALFAACGDNTPASQPDLSTPASIGDLAMASTPMLTVNNTLGWCTVTVTVGNDAPVMFSSATHTFTGMSGTMVQLHAVPNPGFIQVKWTGVTTMNGADATYTMTGAGTQSVTACCPFPDGSGC